MKLKINKVEIRKVFPILLLIFPFIQQRTYSEMPAFFSNFYRVSTIFVSAIIYVIALKNIALLKKDKNLRYFILFWGIYILSTVKNAPGNLRYVLYNALTLFALVLFVAIECKKNVNRLLKVLSIIYGIYIYLNFILGILFPSGLYQTGSYHSAYLLGDDNAMIYVILPGVICMCVYSMQKYNKIKWNVWGAAILSEFLLLKIWSASAMVVLALFMALVLYTLRIGRLNPKTLLLAAISAAIICLFGLNNAVVQSFITGVLHKDITLSNRTFFWEMALIDIMKKPILGYGGFFQYGRWKMSTYSPIAYPCHTPYLQLMLDGGIAVFAVFVCITVLAYKTISRKQKCISSQIFAIGMMCMLVNYITEYAGLHHFFIVTVLMLNIDSLEIMQVRRATKNE